MAYVRPVVWEGERERVGVLALTKEDKDDIYTEPLSPSLPLHFLFFASFSYFTSVSLIGVSGNEALTTEAEQWTVT